MSPAIMDDRLERLSEKAKALPKAPGVYLMKDSKGRVIYVGKSASLRDRVGSYFQPSAKLEFKKAPLRDVVVDFDYIQTESEVEALLAENRLIKDIQPKFNARLLDDKIIGGLSLQRFYPELGNASLWCATELTTREQIDQTAKLLAGSHSTQPTLVHA